MIVRSITNVFNLKLFVVDLFYSIATQKKKVGTIAPKKFIQRLRKENGIYDVSEIIRICTHCIVQHMLKVVFKVTI